MARFPPTRHLRTTLRQLRTYTSSSASQPTLLPSVLQLLHTNHIPDSDIPKIPATGPNNRLLKGDVLAYLGHIPSARPAEQSQQLAKLSHLDLTNIKLAPAPIKEATPAPPPDVQPAAEEPTQLALPISLAAVLACQKKLQDALGVTLPLSTFLTRAVELANESLPRKRAPPTADELFDAVIGAEKIVHGERGNFVPDVLVEPFAAGRRTQRPVDIIDELAGRVAAKGKEAVPSAGVGRGAENVFSVTVDEANLKRGETFLQRMKAILEKEPGRLVL
ncbi:hypothetical protein P152DRAFT_237294 [Eremomyces bilateralis CBS 781.70]|uniref:Peripheral subunit-binding (PSBD) domain-containing protein n=1 Tax=Eremomyces bilateralis CBS 781.70 TaxID=1392243 RepID=A0A6G1GAG4_9PEZI|nr:uncharacterized protein P152DRAFT_237294 [Eremomyces bilateralis CBS 781.70]KAF1814900.1 hypothetical protein P152DRAFT_237294 [Eremomyces bilateralis CBS 781.70]